MWSFLFFFFFFVAGEDGERREKKRVFVGIFVESFCNENSVEVFLLGEFEDGWVRLTDRNVRVRGLIVVGVKVENERERRRFLGFWCF